MEVNPLDPEPFIRRVKETLLITDHAPSPHPHVIICALFISLLIFLDRYRLF